MGLDLALLTPVFLNAGSLERGGIKNIARDQLFNFNSANNRSEPEKTQRDKT